MSADLFQVIDATWPAASLHEAGGFLVREGLGGGSRVSSASLIAPFESADIDAAIAAHRALGQPPKFMIRPGEEALDAALDARGFEVFDPVTVYEAPLAALSDDVPPVSAFAHWPPLAIAAEVWERGGIGAARRAVMTRAQGARAAVLGRAEDHPAGAAFVAVHDGTAMLHALVTLPEFRRKGLGRAIMAETVRWARAAGAEHLALVVTQANGPANALYRGLGMRPATQYHYRRRLA